VVSYQKAIDMDPSFVQCVFNAGVCLNSKAIDLKDQLADKNTGKLTKANADKVKAVLAQAKEYLERAKQLDPDREKVNWAYPLYQIYYSLGDQANAAEMEKLDWMARGTNGAMFKVTRTNLASVLRGWWGQENRKNSARASGGVEPAADVPTVTEGDLIS
jgi:hypothetical protein